MLYPSDSHFVKQFPVSVWYQVQETVCEGTTLLMASTGLNAQISICSIRCATVVEAANQDTQCIADDRTDVYTLQSGAGPQVLLTGLSMLLH